MEQSMCVSQWHIWGRPWERTRILVFVLFLTLFLPFFDIAGCGRYRDVAWHMHAKLRRLFPAVRCCDCSHSRTVNGPVSGRQWLERPPWLRPVSLSSSCLSDESNLSVTSTRPGNQGAVGGQLMQGSEGLSDRVFPLACYMSSWAIFQCPDWPRTISPTFSPSAYGIGRGGDTHVELSLFPGLNRH